MPLSIGNNISSMHAMRVLGNSTDLLQATRERLSSGSRINRASDDAAGLAIATSLTVDTRIGTQAIRNVNDGISLLNVAQGSLVQLEELTTRRRELAEQAANGVYSSYQRQALERENVALADEMHRIIRSTKYNGQSLFDGSLASGLRIQAGVGIDGSISFSLGASINSLASGTFAPVSTSFSVARAIDIQLADFDNDGKLDFVSPYLGDDATPSVGTVVGVSLGNGDGTFKVSQFFSVNEGPIFATVGDYNRDGNTDIAVSNRSTSVDYLTATSVSVILGNGNGTFKAPTSFVTGAGPEQLVSADFTGDGILDLAVSDAGPLDGTTISLLVGNGDGSFKARVSYSSGGIAPFGLSFGDIDGNGSLDLAVPNFGVANGTSLGVLLNNGDGTFKTTLTYQTGTAPDTTTLRDFNADGKLDIAVTNRGNNNGTTFSILMGNGDGSFTVQRSYGTGGLGPTDLSGVDVNNDGRLDLAIVNSAIGSLAIAIGNGDGTFRAAISYEPDTYGGPFGVASADLNGDTAADFLVSNYTNTTVSMFFGTPQLPRASVATAADARDALSSLESISHSIGKELSNIGAAQSRLIVAARNLATKKEQDTAAHSRIADVDVAQESALTVTLQMRQQLGASILAQANQAPTVSLALLT